MIADTVASGEIELDEKYLLNSHKGEKIDNLKPRKRGGSASKRGLSSEQICLPIAVQRNGKYSSTNKWRSNETVKSHWRKQYGMD